MKRRSLIGLLLLWALSVGAQNASKNDNDSHELPVTIRPDSAVFQGVNLRVDLGSPIYEVAMSKGKIQSYELGLNVDLKHKYFPALELGYAGGRAVADGGRYEGYGGYLRVGADLCPLKKVHRANFLVVGLRVGTAVQSGQTTNVVWQGAYWPQTVTTDYPKKVFCDVWGEVVAGVQVQVYKRFHMGWFVRLKILFTRDKVGQVGAYYVPGFGTKQDTNFGFNYYIGFTL